ncbi:hypothetical protein LEP1GSC202_1251 [Leptospira yanagawae serovar Saopaulo str. Sao Paulo = ATCC 700523]|uniref:Uncharacterized protein n=1 Tax=Leptospira yanagawae serovar Saopaulo str. Sao Paulo = ATCC 700523 TaxID=1249483 RepID=A0A5E8HDD8_9LEPT|nr:hypothetical protein [Leptospira yanagawae]EOQ89285.1 hypothetical protein LEP1GSC202_1251 [Leptospira yanagawae serovar Saopaulo str. Sao Paulo = ATCC 700523]
MISTIAKRILIIQIIVVSSLNCALFQKRNLKLTNAVEENLIPKDGNLRIIAAPIYLPLGVGAGILDVFIIHPIAVIPDAAEDTIGVLWTSQNSGYYTKLGAIPFSALATPPFFIMAWSYHWFFNDNDRPHEVDTRTTVPTKLNTFEDWKKKMYEAIQDKDLQKMYEYVYEFEKFRRNPETVLILIEVRERLAKQKKQNEETNLLSSILSFPSSNEKVRKYILQEFLISDSSLNFRQFIRNCKELECKSVILKKIKNLGNDPYTLTEFIKLYFEKATPEEKERFMKHLQAIE